MKRKRKSYTKDFKVMAVELCLSGKSIREVSTDIGVSRDIVRRWKREYLQDQASSFPGNGKSVLSAEQAEIARLKKELREAQLERDILKKAVRIFSRSDG
ncbi:MAG: transposase [Bacteroidota bacterium]